VRRLRTSSLGRDHLWGRALDYASFYSAAAAHLARAAKRGDIIVAKSDPPLLSVLGAGASALRGARQVNWVQDLYPEVALALGVRGLNGPHGRLLKTLRDRSLTTAAANVVIGNGMADRVAELGVPRERIEIIPNWCDDAAIQPVPRCENRLRSEWGLDGKFVVGYSGNLGRAHEIGTILGAAEILRDRRDITFLFIGGGHLRDKLKCAVASRGLQSFAFKPYQPPEQLAHSLSVADVHWVSLRPELEGLILPSKVYGIAAAGRPIVVVASPDGELAKVVRHHDAGLAVRAGDSAGFAAAIVRLADDPAARERMGRNARTMVEGTFSRAVALRRWTDLIVRLEEAKSPP
jgi:glycosyltransferase involved in cell wall biosynthesis